MCLGGVCIIHAIMEGLGQVQLSYSYSFVFLTGCIGTYLLAFPDEIFGRVLELKAFISF